MHAPEQEPVRYAQHYWYDDLDLPGAWDMLHVRRLMESRPFVDRIPFQKIVKNKYFPETDYIVATRGKDYVMVYIPTGKGVRLDLGLCGWPVANAWWYDCNTGSAVHLKRMETGQVKYFEPKARGRGHDWVLVLDNAARSFGPPGQ